MNLSELILNQRRFFASGKTLSYEFRLAELQKLKRAIGQMESDLLGALKKDLNKAPFEGFTSEVGFVLGEINHAIKQLPHWMRSRSVSTPLVFQPGRSRIYAQPRGCVLIIGPWNYPFQLLFAPLVGAIAAGNCVILKPSELATATERVVRELIEKTFSPEFVGVVCGSIDETTALLKERFDHIFFTGSVAVGKVVMRAAAEHLTPVTLELGGKSPCIVDEKIDLSVTARRIVWGKFSNAGQTCIAPDYLLVPKTIKNDLMGAIRQRLLEFFGERPKESPDYGRIINERNFDRLVGLLDKSQIYLGGQNDRKSLYIAPTVLDNVRLDSKVMEDEIFGPILPVITYESLDEALTVVAQHPNPLACYVFTKNRAFEERIIREVPFGGGCVNNTLGHYANPHLPFGGVGESGMGAYHGQKTFETLSHYKSILRSSFRIDMKTKYPPYHNKFNLLKKLRRSPHEQAL